MDYNNNKRLSMGGVMILTRHSLVSLMGATMAFTIIASSVIAAPILLMVCRNPTLKECEDETHTPEMGT